jgi:hypothetical protein
MTGFVRGIGLVGAASRMRRDHVRSQYGLKVGAHDFLDTIDLRESCQGPSVRLWGTLPVCPQSLDGNVQSNLVPILEAVCDSLLCGVNPYRNIVDRNDLNARPKRRLGVPENPKRYAVDFWNVGVTGKRDIDRMRNLGGESVVRQR